MARTRADTEWLAGFETRVVGSADHDRALEELLSKVRAIPGIRVWTQEFPLVVPEFGDARLTVEAGPVAGPHRIYPFWPCMARLNTTPPDGISGELVYAGTASQTELPARSLRGQIAVMEITGRDNWMHAYNAGARAILVLGSDTFTHRDAAAHLSQLPLYVPRFYLPDGRLANALRDGPRLRGTLHVAARWRETKATNIYALVKPKSAANPLPAIALAAPFDSMSVVPELAPGADRAVDTAFLLNSLRELAKNRPSRPVLFAFVDGYSINQRGARKMLSTFGIPREQRDIFLKKDKDKLDEYIKNEALAKEIDAHPNPLRELHRRERTVPLWLLWFFTATLAVAAVAIGKVTGWRNAFWSAAAAVALALLILVKIGPDRRTGQHCDYKPLHRYVKDEVAREVIAIESKLLPLRLEVSKVLGEEKARLKERVDALVAERKQYLAAQTQLLTKARVTEEGRALAEDLWRRARMRAAGQLKQLNTELAAHEAEDALRVELLAELGLGPNEERPISFLLGLDISDAGEAAGPALHCRHLHHDEKTNSHDFRAWLVTIRKKEMDSVWPAALRKAVNLAPLLGMDDVASYVLGNVANLTSPAQSFGIAAMTWATLDITRQRVDTPLDRPDRLDWQRLGPQLDATWALVRRLVTQTDFQPDITIVNRWRGVRGVVVDQSLGEPVPRLPMNGYLTTLVSGNAAAGQAHVAGRAPCVGVRLYEFAFTGIDGRFRFDALPARAHYTALRYFVQSFKLAEDGRIIRAIDMNKAGRGVRLNINITSADASPLRAVAFTCEELTAVDLIDPRFVVPLYASSILDAVRGGKPQRCNFSIRGSQMSAFLEPGVRWQLILRLGTSQNRMALINMATPAEAEKLTTREAMRGFEITKRLPSTPVHMALQDFWNLNQHRLNGYERAGITSTSIAKIRTVTRNLMTEADAALARDDGPGFFNASVGAMANEVRAYQAIRHTGNDVVRAAIFLLLGLIPFSFAMERLLVATPHIYRQLGGMAVIFFVMTLVLWSFHPAFRISNQPLIIIMAFGVIAMSLQVISVVYSKFATSLEEMRSGRAESSGARTSRMGVVSSAIRLGIANMRKRKLRTTLTGTTIVLITFALLCFTSVSSYVGKKQFRLGVAGAYTGVVIRQPSSKQMPERVVPYLRTFLGPDQTIAPRYWWVSGAPGWRLHVRNPGTGKQLSLQAGLGLVPEEATLTGVDRFLPNWAEFGGGHGCYLAKSAAQELGVRPGARVTVMGRSLTLLGVFDAARFASEARTLDGQSLLPYDYSGLGREQRQSAMRISFDVLTAEMATGEGLEPEEDLPHLAGASVIVLPAALLEGMQGCSLRSVAMSAVSAEAATQTAMTLAGRLGFPVYFGSPAGVSVVAATGLRPHAPKNLLFPLLIAGLIIFNTMLSSIAERKREIHVYTSLGLAPLHIGVLFVAEAITYGLMGSIFGYVVGQGVATGLSKLGWLGGITLNYSGTQALATMVMVLAIVVLSSLVPAFMAGRIASPSHEMSWKVPQPENDVIRDILPFTVTNAAANGVIHFLYEFLDAHRDGGVGNFSTDRLRTVTSDLGGHTVMGIEGTVWLAPYDLGVRQNIRISIVQSDTEDICEIHLELFRGAGQVRTWWKLNRVFLGDLRKQLLGWRNISSERILEYIAGAKEMLEKTG